MEVQFIGSVAVIISDPSRCAGQLRQLGVASGSTRAPGEHRVRGHRRQPCASRAEELTRRGFSLLNGPPCSTLGADRRSTSVTRGLDNRCLLRAGAALVASLAVQSGRVGYRVGAQTTSAGGGRSPRFEPSAHADVSAYARQLVTLPRWGR